MPKLCPEQVAEKFPGFFFVVENDVDTEGFFSVWAYKNGSGCEVAGKIGERVVADFIVSALNTCTR